MQQRRISKGKHPNLICSSNRRSSIVKFSISACIWETKTNQTPTFI